MVGVSLGHVFLLPVFVARPGEINIYSVPVVVVVGEILSLGRRGWQESVELSRTFAFIFRWVLRIVLRQLNQEAAADG